MQHGCGRFFDADRQNVTEDKLEGVIFDSELNFVQHCKEKINTAYSYLRVIKRNFIYLDEDAFVMLYNSLVRSHLEYPVCKFSMEST